MTRRRLFRGHPKRVVGPALRAGRAQGVRKTGDRETILASSVTSLRMSCSRPAAERGPYLLFPALSHRLTLFGQRLFRVSFAVLALFGAAWRAEGAPAPPKEWVGGASGATTDWNTAANWDSTGVPDSADVKILTGKTYYPILYTPANNDIKSLTINNGGQLTLQAGGSLAASKNIDVDGSLNIVDGTLAGKDIKGDGTIAMSNGLLQVSHDFKPTSAANFSASGGTVQFTGNPGGGTFPAGTYQFYDLLIDSGVDPEFGKNTSTFNIKGSLTNNGSATFIGTSVNFNGLVAQTIGGTATTPFTTLVIANTGDSVSLTQNISVAASCTVNDEANLEMSSQVMSGGGDFTLASGGTLGVGATDGITLTGATGAIQVTGTRSYNTAAHYIYNGTANQTSGNGLPGTVASLTVENTAGTVTLDQLTAITTTASLSSGSALVLPTGTTSTADTLWLGGVLQASGTWGGTNSAAEHTNSTYFPGASTGILNVNSGVIVTSISGVTASQSITYGTTSVSLSGTVSATGPLYPADGETVSVTIDGVSTNATVAGGAGGFAIDFPTATIPYSPSPYVITYAYAGNGTLAAAQDNTSTALTVNQLAVELSGSRDYDGTPTAIASILAVDNNLDGANLTISGSATLPSKNIGSQAISAGTLSLSGSAANNYTLTGLSGSVTITTLAITVTAVTDTKDYDGTTSSTGMPTITSGTLAAGDTATWSQTFDTQDVGTGKTLTPGGTVTDGNGGTNYNVTLVSIDTGVILALPTYLITGLALNESNMFVLEWQGTNAWQYTVQFRPSLLTSSWNNVVGFIDIPGTNATMSAAMTNDLINGQARFHRILMSR